MAHYGADHSGWRNLSTPIRHEQSRCARPLERSGRRTFRGRRWTRNRGHLPSAPKYVWRRRTCSQHWLHDFIGGSRQGRGTPNGRALFAASRERGFKAVQFNFVVSTNERAIRLYKDYGFDIIGTLPLAFLHPKRGYVDVLVMFKAL
jgi:hypothetical protein